MEPQGLWVSYSGGEAIALALVLLAIAGVLAYLATRLPVPLAVKQPGRATAAFMLTTWVLVILTFLVGATTYVRQMQQAQVAAVQIANPIGAVTYPAVLVTFIVVFYLGESRGTWTALTSAAIGALAAPWIFELPFDLIVMGRTYPPVPPDPTLYRLAYFVPLVAVEVSTYALLTLSPMVRLSKHTLRALSAMFLVFALWAALFGFAYPSSLGPIVLNDVSKILAFVAAVTLFLPDGWRPSLAEFRARRRAPWVPPPGL
jgi:hypothetical protein